MPRPSQPSLRTVRSAPPSTTLPMTRQVTSGRSSSSSAAVTVQVVSRLVPSMPSGQSTTRSTFSVPSRISGAISPRIDSMSSADAGSATQPLLHS